MNREADAILKVAEAQCDDVVQMHEDLTLQMKASVEEHFSLL